MLLLVRRILVVAAYAFWIGGLTFYGAVVIPISTRVVGGHTLQGLVTQQVTRAVNLLAVPALAVLLWNLLAEFGPLSRFRRAALLATWCLMLGTQVALVSMHAKLGAMVDQEARLVLERPRFDVLHERYIKLTAAQHVTSVAHLALVLLAWRKFDGAPSESSEQVRQGAA